MIMIRNRNLIYNNLKFIKRNSFFKSYATAINSKKFKSKKPTYDGTGKLPPNDSYLLASRVKELSERNKFNEALTLVQSESKGGGIANVVVWNQILQQSRLSQSSANTYKLFMEMKKRGVVPNSRSYTIIFRSLAGKDNEKPNKKSVDYAYTLISQLENYQYSISQNSALNDKDLNDELSVVPINAYLTLLAKVAHSHDMIKHFENMPDTGYNSADLFTFTILFQGLLRSSQPKDIEQGKELWKLYEWRLKSYSDYDRNRILPDSALISNVLRLFSKGDEKVCKFGLNIAHKYLGVPPSSPFGERKTKVDEFSIPLNDKLVDSLFHLGISSKRYKIVIRHADHILGRGIRLSTRVMYFALVACANDNNAVKALEFLKVMIGGSNKEKPDSQSFDQVMTACMRSQDFELANLAFELLNKEMIPIDTRIMSSYLKCANETNNRENILNVLDKFEAFNLDQFFKTDDENIDKSNSVKKHQHFWEFRLANALEEGIQNLKNDKGDLTSMTRSQKQRLESYKITIDRVKGYTNNTNKEYKNKDRNNVDHID